MKIIVLSCGQKRPSTTKVIKEVVKHTGLKNLFKTNVEFIENEKAV